jgi:ABC-type multidrug transport system ATPase subunit
MRIGSQFQESLFPDDLKVYEILYLFARASRDSLKKSQIAKLAEEFNLGEV